MNRYQAGLGDRFQALIFFENIAIFIYVALVVVTLVLLFKHRKAAKHFAIATLLFAAVYGLIDYAISSSIFETSGLAQSSELKTFMSKYANDVGRSVLAAFIWIPYFLVSKRVKRTLTQ